ncbi:MAG: winged helix-turn-helix domain-containing protein, partial [bacterium]|nr:winged helix-turn-helix domain-containing protein [bacterium]
LALARAGLLKPEWTGLPQRAAGRGKRARQAAQRIVERFGYLQLDTVSIAGARSHAIVLMSRLEGIDPGLGEELLRPGEPLFEYWGHEASWLPIDLYPHFEFRRKEYQTHPWWGDLLEQHPDVAARLVSQITNEGPMRSVDMEGAGSRGWWDLKLAKKVATALWSSGRLAIRERRSFQRTYDLAERVIPDEWRQSAMAEDEALEQLLLVALQGHGWATIGTLSQTWRLRGKRDASVAALRHLQDRGEVLECGLKLPDGKLSKGWIRPSDLELADRLRRVRPRRDRGVLLSPFDPVLWDRTRVEMLFGFHQVLEIFKPAEARIYGYYCLPVLAGERLVARYDLKAESKKGLLRVLSLRHEGTDPNEAASAADGEAVRTALERFAEALALKPVFG